MYLLQNVFKIPPSLVLPEDRVHGDPECSDEAVATLNDKIHAVTDRIIAVRGTCQIVFHVMSENVWLVSSPEHEVLMVSYCGQ